MLKSRTLEAAAQLGLMSLEACVTPAERTHHYGSRGEPMRDSAATKIDTARRPVHLGCNPQDPTTTQRVSN